MIKASQAFFCIRGLQKLFGVTWIPSQWPMELIRLLSPMPPIYTALRLKSFATHSTLLGAKKKKIKKIVRNVVGQFFHPKLKIISIMRKSVGCWLFDGAKQKASRWCASLIQLFVKKFCLSYVLRVCGKFGEVVKVEK